MKRTIISLSIAAVAVFGPSAAAVAATGTAHQGSHSHALGVTPACGCSGGHHGHKRPSGHHGGAPGRHHHKHPSGPIASRPGRGKPCPPPKHHHPKAPPIVVHPKPPVITPGPKPVAHVISTTPAARVRSVEPTALPAQLAMTASPYELNVYVLAGFGAVGAGGIIVALTILTSPARRFNRQVTR